MDSDDLFSRMFSRENVLGGTPPTRRARTILFQIESHTAYLVAQSRQVMERFLTEKTAQERDMAFIEAFALGRNLPLKPTIQDLERYAPQWAGLVPDRAEVRAAIAHQLAAKYQFTAAMAPGLRTALGLGTQPVQQAYRHFYDTPLESIYAAETTALDRLRWTWNRLGRWLEALPPFWSVFALTLTETVGASILALPIALAGIGPLPGIVLLLVFGLVNVLTVAYMAETASRSSDIRYGNSFMGQMVTEYLGHIGSMLLSLGVLVLCLFAILAFYIGFATTLTDATLVPSWVWVILLFGIGLYFVTRGSLNATVTLALVVGAINLLMIVALIFLTAPYITLDSLVFVNLPFSGGRSFDISHVGLVFGIIFAAFFGHLSVPNSARMVLRQDPGGGALVRGAMAAQAVAIVINSLWVLAVNGAIPPEALANESGTSLIPLAATVGPGVHVFGTVFVVLGLGMVSVHLSLALYNLTREWLPQWQGPAITLPRRQGRLRFGLSMADFLTLPEEQSNFINWMLRARRVDLAQAAAYLGQTPEEVRSYLAPLIEQGFVHVLNLETIPYYEVRMAATRSRHLSQTPAEAAAAASKFRRQPAFLKRSLNTLLGERGRSLLGLAPLIVIFLAAQWQLFTGNESFSGPLSFIGVVVIAMLAGIFPALLLRASRRRGDIVPEVVYHIIGHPVFLVIIFVLSLTGIVLHGLFIWQDLIMRGLALVISVVIMGMTINAWRQGAFIPRFIVELRSSASMGHPTRLTLAYSGVPLEAGVRLVFVGDDAGGQQVKAKSHEIPELVTLQSATIQLPAIGANEVKVLAHQITPEGNSLALPVTAQLDAHGSTRQVNLMETGGQATLQLHDQASQLTLVLRKKTP